MTDYKGQEGWEQALETLKEMNDFIKNENNKIGEENDKLKEENKKLKEANKKLKEFNILLVEMLNQRSSYIEKLEEEIKILKNTKPTPIVSANGEFRYNFYLENFKMTREELAQKVHKINCEKHGWDYHPLKVGSFGFDNLIMSIGYKLRDNNGPVSIHDGWSENYTYWTLSKPYEGKYNYIAPFNKLGDERRTKLSQTNYDDLDMKEKQKDIIIDEAVDSMVVNQ